MRWLSVVKPVLRLVYFAPARDTDFPDCDWAPKRPRRRRRVMLSTSAARLSHASISNICSGRQRWTQSATVAISPVTVRLITMGIAASDQRAIRGQLATIARPGTKKMNPSASTVRLAPTRFSVYYRNQRRGYDCCEHIEYLGPLRHRTHDSRVSSEHPPSVDQHPVRGVGVGGIRGVRLQSVTCAAN